MKEYLWKTAFVLTTVGMLMISCSKDDDDEGDDEPENIITTARTQGDLDIFVEGLEQTGLDEELSEGSYTLFAPNDEMFQAFLLDLGFNNITELINELGEARARDILLYHVLNGTVVRADEFGNSYVSTAAESDGAHQLSLYISRFDTLVNLNGNAATIVKRNIDAGNGIIHKINGVLPLPTITLLLEVNPDYSTLVQAMRNAEGNLTTTFRQENIDVTLFAPGNDAFIAYFNDDPRFSDFNSFFQELGADNVKEIVLYHTLETNKRAEALETGAYQTMLNGKSVSIDKDNTGNISISGNGENPAQVTTNNITAVNGSIHRIDYVLSPQ